MNLKVVIESLTSMVTLYVDLTATFVYPNSGIVIRRVLVRWHPDQLAVGPERGALLPHAHLQGLHRGHVRPVPAAAEMLRPHTL